MEWKGYTIEATVRKNCRRLILRCRPGEKRLYLSVPRGVTKRQVQAFLEAHEEWIAAQMYGASPWEPRYAAGEEHRLFGGWVTIGQNSVPAGQTAFEAWRARQLTEAVGPVIADWEKRLGVRCAGVRLRDMTSRWGSCQTVTGMITLNLRLARVPVCCLEYVAAHELCHLIHPNHSDAFHWEMTRVMPDWRERKKQLNAFDLRPRPGAAG